MAKLKYKSIIPTGKPYWLLLIQYQVGQQYAGLSLRNTADEFEALKYFIDTSIGELYKNKTVTRSVIETEIRTDEGKTVLFIRRNGKMLQTYYIEN